MNKFRRVVVLFCHEQKSMQEMTRIGYSENRERVLFRCHGCGMNHAFPFATMIRDGFAPPSKKLTREQGVASYPDVLAEYSPAGVYQVGQRIHHTVFDDIGKVIAENTANGHGKIVVAFEKSGKKILIHRLTNGPAEYAKP
jgi:hypothetical protein